MTTSSTVEYRPQTLRQAKAAYRKSGLNRRFTEVETRQINRNAELLERADRIKKKELKKKRNKQNKEHKLEKEKEARRKVGLPEVREAYISPSQPKLGAFLRTGMHQKSESKTCNSVDETNSCPNRSALKPISGNRIIGSARVGFALPVKPPSPLEAECADFIFSRTSVVQEFSLQIPGSLNYAHAAHTLQDETPTAQLSITPKRLNQNSTEKDSSPITTTQKHYDKDINVIHELVDGDSKKLMPGEDHSVIPTVQKGAEDLNIIPAIQQEDSDFENGFTDDDLQGLAQGVLAIVEGISVFETQSGVSKPNYVSNVLLQQKFNEDAIFDECAPSSQDLLNLFCEDDFDEPIPTQDLLDLVP